MEIDGIYYQDDDHAAFGDSPEVVKAKLYGTEEKTEATFKVCVIGVFEV